MLISSSRRNPPAPQCQRNAGATGAGLEDINRYFGHAEVAHASELYGHWDEDRTRELGASLTLRLMGEYDSLTKAADDLADEVVVAAGLDRQ